MAAPVRLLLLCIAWVATVDADAATRTWPGPAPCNGTLQACIDASAAADTVLVASNASVASSTLLVNKPLILRAAPGFRPRVDAGAAIAGTVNAAGSWTWHVEGFSLAQGFVQLNVQGGDVAEVVIRDNRIGEALSGAAEISLFKPSAVTTTINYAIERNVLDYFWDTFDGSLRAAIQVLDGGSGNSTGRIAENRVTATGNQSIGILVSTIDRSHRLAVHANTVLGGRSGSIYLRQGSLVSPGGGSIDALVANNVIRSAEPGEARADGIKAEVFDGALALDVLHNTITDAFGGVDVLGNTGTTVSGRVEGNVFAYLTTDGLRRSGTAGALTDSSNLFHETLENAATPGLNADSLFADPRFVRLPDDPHLAADSPAIDVLTSTSLLGALTAHGLHPIDGDGLRRVKRANSVLKSNPLDLGALEAGDTSLLHRVGTAPGLTSRVEDPVLDGFAAALPQVTPNWNPDGVGGVYSNYAVSAVYSDLSGYWFLRQEALDPFAADAAFNLFAPGRGEGRFLHDNATATTTGSFTELDDASVNGREDAILQVTRNPGSGTIVDLVSPLAVNYFSGVWSVLRTDGGTMPALGGFNVYAQPPSANAYVHVASAGNIFGNVTDLDHPLLNGHPCARVHVTHYTDLGVTNNVHTGVYYEFSVERWSIFNQNIAPMPVGARFHVVVDPQAVDCRTGIFSDGFENP